MKLSESDPIVRGIRIKGLKTSHTHNTSYQNIDINSKINTLLHDLFLEFLIIST